MRLRRILTDTGVRSPASWEVRHRHAGWGPGAGRVGDTAVTERGAATAAYGGPFCQTSESSRASPFTAGRARLPDFRELSRLAVYGGPSSSARLPRALAPRRLRRAELV